MALLRIQHIYDTPSKKDELEEIVLDFIKTKQLPEKIINFYSNYVNTAKQREKIKNSAKRKKVVRYL